MNLLRACSVILVCAGIVLPVAKGETFATFPERKELISPDGRFVLRSVDPPHEPMTFTSTFHTLVLEDRGTGKTWRVYDYLYKVAVAFSGDRIVGTDYVSRRGARAVALSVDPKSDSYIIDRVALADRLPLPLASHLQFNDHVFVEGVRMEGNALVLRAWGYGTHDRQGFRLACRLILEPGTASCEEGSGGTSPQ